jgi:tryptophanyl-tRNA synthetase
MSKSSDDFNGTIYFNDSKDSIIKKFKSSVTDSQNEIKYDMESKPGISNLIEIYSAINAIELKDTEKQFQDFRYGDFKLAVAESVISYLEPIAEKFREISDSQIDSAIENNLKLAKVSAELTISEIETALGID